MSVNSRDRLGEDGISGNSPALGGRNPCYFRLNLRECRLNQSDPAPNSLRLRILPTSPMGSGFYADFRLSPPLFSGFYEQGGEGEGGAPLLHGPGAFLTLCKDRSYRTIPQCNPRYSSLLKEAPHHGVTSSTRAQHSV